MDDSEEDKIYQKQGDKKTVEQLKSLIKTIWNESWNRSYIPVFLFVAFILMVNAVHIYRQKYDGERIFKETRFNLTTHFDEGRFTNLCGWIIAKFGYHLNRTCSGHTLYHRRHRYGCFLSECGDPKRISCRRHENGWISKDVVRCPDPSRIRHFCCRPQSRLCTWQGVWSSVRSLQDVDCRFEPDSGCGKLICNNGEHQIVRDKRGRCQKIYINGKLGSAKCGQIDFADESDTWFKKVDAYSTLDYQIISFTQKDELQSY